MSVSQSAVFGFSGKCALVTGGAHGIGKAAAIAFARSGAKVAIVDRDAAGAQAVCAEIIGSGAEALAVTADVSRSADVQAYVAATLAAFGRIDAFFNNAGIEGVVQPTQDYDEAVFDQVIAVNAKGVFLGMRHVLPVMVRQGAGAVVKTASTAGLSAVAGMVAYGASKHAVIGMTRTAAVDVARAGVRVNAVCPGPVDTRMIEALAAQIDPADAAGVRTRYEGSIPTGRYSTPEDIANMVLFLCSDLARNITGSHHLVDGGRLAGGGPSHGR